ncbi:MAG: DUF4173 domain-containing protein [Oscillospiraceae bacterium]|jgi:hypothetical protein|nr:DUF4173 domain-containing protein [Oscillospiraceae bacterium]
MDETKNPMRFTPDYRDAIMAIAALALGYLFERWVLFSWFGYGVSLFTALYLAATAAYFRVRGHRLSRDAVFALAATLLVGLSYALWDNAEFNGYRSLFLFCGATYWVAAACGFTLGGMVGSFAPFDLLNVLVIVPFGNLGALFTSPRGFKRHAERRRNWGLIVGIVIALLLFIIVVPSLLRADGGAFSQITGGVADAVSRFFEELFGYDFVIHLIVAIPVAIYMFGLIYGGARGRRTAVVTADGLQSTRNTCRVLPRLTSEIALTALAGLYVVYIACQVPYFFSAFGGSLPDGWLSVTEYARSGFFELCSVAVITLAAMLVMNGLCRTPFRDSKLLRTVNIALSVETIILIASAISKFALYLAVDGATMKRVLPCVFMAFLAVLFVGVIVLQFRQFNIARYAVALGAVIMVALSFVNADALVIRSNVARYKSGEIGLCDVDLFRRAGYAGVEPAIELLNTTELPSDYAALLREYVKERYEGTYAMLSSKRDGVEVSVEYARAQAAVRRNIGLIT